MGQVALVTGGSIGIGQAICRQLLEAGYDVVSLSLPPPDARARLTHARLHSIEVDLSDTAATAQAAAEVARRFEVTTLVHNAGVIRPALLADVQLADLQVLVNLHVAAALTLTQAVLPTMRAAHFGRVVLISSRAALGLATRTAYSATKAGLIGMARTWSLELAPDGITVNVVAPGPILTDQFYAITPADSPKVQQLANSVPVRRLGTPDDVANAVLFLAAPASSFITGQVLYVCGGTSVGSLII